MAQGGVFFGGGGIVGAVLASRRTGAAAGGAADVFRAGELAELAELRAFGGPLEPAGHAVGLAFDTVAAATAGPLEDVWTVGRGPTSTLARVVVDAAIGVAFVRMRFARLAMVTLR